MLKFKVKDINEVEEAYRSFYVQVGDEWFLQMEGAPDVAGITAENERLKAFHATVLEEKKAEQAKRKEAEEAARIQAEEAAKKAGDVAALEASWKEQSAKAVGEVQSKLDAMAAGMKVLLVDNVAQQMANGFLVPESSALAVGLIKQRLAVEYDAAGNASTRVLDAAGQPSALTIDQLKEELRANPAWAPLILGRQAAGGGGESGNGGGAAKTFAEMTGAEKVSLNKSNPAEYDRLKAESK